MSISSKTLNSSLQQLARSSNFTALTDKATEIGDQVAALSATSLGEANLDEIVGGMKPLTSGLGSAGVALLTKGIPGITEDIVKNISDDKVDLDGLTGGAVENGFLDLVAASASAEGIKAALQQVAPTITSDQISTVLTDIVPDRFVDLVSTISDIENTFSTFASNLTSSVAEFQRTSSELLNGASFLKDFVTKIDSSPLNQIEALGVAANQAQDVLNLIDTGDLIGAAELVSSSPNVAFDITTIETKLAQIDTSVGGRVSFSNVEQRSAKAIYDTNSNANRWGGSNTVPEVFSIVSSLEQQMLDFVKNEREITQVVLFGIETTDQQNLRADDIHQQHNDAGINGIGFHYVVMSNGVVQRGRPLSVQSEILENHDPYSIMIGIPHSGTSITTDQSKSLGKIMQAFYMTWPGGKLLDAHQIDPEIGFNLGFDIYDLKYALGNKLNFGGYQSSLSTKQLIASGTAI